MSAQSNYQPHVLNSDDIQEPPKSLWQALRKIGPGIVLAGSIVGSGELIITTGLGAEFGFVFLWLVLFSCIVKVFVQIELGRYAISSGLPTLAALNGLPGPRARAHWLVWWWFFMLLATVTQLGGIIGGIAQALHLLVPQIPLFHVITKVPVGSDQVLTLGLPICGIIIALAAIVILLSGGYRMIEKLTTVLVVSVTALTVLGVFALQYTPYKLTLGHIATGLAFTVPAAANWVDKAFSCFGITGVGANELYYYPYWCIEKGYAKWTGPNTGDADWTRRAKGWMRVLHLDAWVSMLVFTAATVSFYLLGAAVLHPQGLVPKNEEMIRVLSQMYVPSFGAWTATAFLVGAFVVLFKTLYVSGAGHSRLTTDFFGLARFVDMSDPETRRLWIRGLCVFYVLLALALYWIFGGKNPAGMVVFGGIVQAATLPIITGATMYLRYKKLDPRLKPSPLSDLCLWFAFITITAAAVYFFYSQPMFHAKPKPTSSVVSPIKK